MSILTDVMNWFQGRSAQEDSSENPTRQSPRRPKIIDMTEGLTVNDDLTRGLWRNTYPGLKLAGSLAFPPIFVPLSMMGVPVPSSDDEKTQELLTAIVERMAFTCWQLHKTCHRDGTTWIWPAFTPAAGLRWEFINDATVADIIKDVTTEEVIEVRTDEQLRISVGESDVRTVRRIRSFTRQRLAVRYEGSTIPGLESAEYMNPSGELPIAFANNGEPNETRGTSEYSRILPDLKNYHDIDHAWTVLLAKFRAKMVLGVSNVDKWLEDNGYDSIDDVDVATADLVIVNTSKEETVEIVNPPLTEAYASKLKNTFHKIVEASGIPEIVWGLKTEGNHASAEEQMGSLVQYVVGKREQKDEPYRRLFAASLRLTGIASMTDTRAFNVTWNRLDAVTDAVRAEIFKNFAQAIGAVMKEAAITDRQLHAMWKANFPEATEEDYEEFTAGMVRAAKFRQYSQATLDDAFDMTSPYEDPDDDGQAEQDAEAVEGESTRPQNIRALQ